MYVVMYFLVVVFPLQKCCLCAADISASFTRAAYTIHVCSIRTQKLAHIHATYMHMR